MLKKAWQHFKLVNKHRWIVYQLSKMAGIGFRGLVHDLSKYSFTEFLESVKYYNGSRSPVQLAREEKEYSKAWLHHKGRNKHHEEYWYDFYATVKAPIIPYKYAVEMICDSISAGLVYKKDEWTKDYPLYYWNERKDKSLFHPKMVEFFEDVYKEISINGVDKTITKENLKNKYEKYCKQ